MKIRLPQLLLIAGTGRNTGKTTLACTIIRNISRYQPVVAIKITPHFHANSNLDKMIINRNGLVIAEEKQANTEKDSSRMMRAGAETVFFVMANDEQLAEAIRIILDQNTKNLPIVCESGGLRHHIEPGLFLMMNRSDQTEYKPETIVLKAVADHWITFNGSEIDFNPETITYSANKWQITAKN